MNKKPVIWVLADDRAGNSNQAIGVAERLGTDFEIKTIRYNKSGRLHNLIRGRSLLGVDLANSSPLSAPWPDIVIGAGRKTAPISRFIKKQSGGKTHLVHLMLPGFPDGDFDLIFTPKHDNIKNNDKYISSIGAPNRITPGILAQHKAKWEEKFAHLPSSKIALLIGGNTKKGEFTAAHARDLISKISAFIEGKGLLITNSRRTSEEVTQILKDEIKNPAYFHDVRSGGENPYFGYLANADLIITSGDSISMCSESCSTGKPVYIYAPENITPQKHQNFHKNLYETGYASPLTGIWQEHNYTPLDDAGFIAGIIKNKWLVSF